jgi:trimeric autotransporter adhesin
MSGLNPPGPLTYTGQVVVPTIQRNFAPTTSDNKFTVPTIWTWPAAKKAYILVNKELGIADWLIFATSSGPIDSIITDDGNTVLPNGSGQVNVAGGANITTSSVDLSDTATISVSGTTEYAVQVGSAAGALTSLTLGTSGQVLTSAGAGSNPSWQTPSAAGITTIDGDSGSMTGSTVTISGGTTGLTTSASGATMDLTGMLGVANGGTGATTLTGVLVGHGTGAITGNTVTQHDVLVGGASNAITSVSPSTAGFVLTSNGAGSDPSFKAVSASGAVIELEADDATTASPSSGIITVSGGSTGLTTTASGSTLDLTGVLALAYGGTSANLTASNGGIFYSTASAGAILAGTATAHQLLLSGASTTPLWSTSTYPTTNAVNTLLYASSANVMAALATANDGVLITSNSGVPSWLANSGTPGYVLTANSGAPPSWQAASASGSITTIDGDSGSMTPSAGVVTISGGTTGLTTTASSATMDLTGTLIVGNGGTGKTTFTAYSVITAGTTATGAFQNVVGVGTSGQVLTSNGASALPTWQTQGANALQIDMDAGTSPIAPSSDVLIFTGAQVAAGVVGTNVIRSDGSASNTMTMQIQRSTTAATSTVADNGVCHFSSTNFTVDSNGFVQLVGGGGSLSTLTGNSGGAISPSSGNINTLGTGSITIVGSGNTLTTQLTGLTNHAVQVGAGTATLTQVGPSSVTGAILQSNGSSSDPSFSTASYPSTTSVSQILYSSSNNVVAGLSTANSAVLVTNSSGVPSWSSTMTNGQLIIGSTGATPTANTLTAGAGVTITNGAGTITIAAVAGTFPWTDESVNFLPAINNGYFVTATATATLPTTPAQGSVIQFAVDSVAGKLTIQAPAAASIRLGSTVSAAAGTAVSSKDGDSITLVYRTSDQTWIATSSIGNWNVT